MSRRYDPVREYEREQRRLAAEERREVAEARRRERERQRQHMAKREVEAAAKNEELAERSGELDALVTSGVARDATIRFESLKRPREMPRFDPKGLDRSQAPPMLEQFLPPRPGFIARLFGATARYERGVDEARQKHAAATARHEAGEKKREEDLAKLRSEYSDRCAELGRKLDDQHAEVDQLERDFAARRPEAVARFYETALARDTLPDGFPTVHRVAYVSESRQLVVEREMPGVDVIPPMASFRYVKSKDSIEHSARPAAHIKNLYAGMVARFALRTLDAVTRADAGDTVETIVLSCFVNTIDPATGHQIRPCLLTVRTGTKAFRDIGLAKVDPLACLRGLNAQVSASPHELRPVRPIVDFNMVDARFIATTDVLSTIDQRPNLAQLSPGEFEALITNLFAKMGLETRLTQASRDGGVDCVAWDMRPIVGGKVIVQAKRYKHTVGVSAVRDLYGTVMNEGAAKGILVTTSGYGKSAFEFARNKPLELLPGSQLLYLLQEHAGVNAKIEFPDDWIDPNVTSEEPE